MKTYKVENSVFVKIEPDDYALFFIIKLHLYLRFTQYSPASEMKSPELSGFLDYQK